MASTNSTQSRSTGIAGMSAQDPNAGGTTNAPTPNGSPAIGNSNLFGALVGIWRPPPADPFQESGRMGTAVWGGYVQNIEKDRRLAGQNRYKTASDILANVSIVAAGLRFFLNLTSVPAWTIKPAEDLPNGQSSDQAKRMADFVQSILDDMDTPWGRIIRRSGMYRFHGFGIHEWTAKRRDGDGFIGIADLEQRPQHTIERWELADDGTIVGMWQRWPQNGQLLFLPRNKVVYLVDDTMTDSPEGLGLFRHLVEPAERIRRYLKMEGLGYERDLRGLPVGKAPLEEIRAMVEAGDMTEKDADAAIAGITNFIKMQVKEEDSAILVDSAQYREPNSDGYNLNGLKYGIDLLTAGSTGFHDINVAIDRQIHEMARILGVETLLLGSQGGGSGSKSLSVDKSRNLYLAVDATVRDIAASMRRDLLGAIWWLNGFDPALMPKLHTEDVAFKDVAVVAKALADMATAGAILAPDDPAINDVRDLLGVSRQPEGQAGIAAETALLPRVTPPKSGNIQTGGASAGGAAGAPAPKPGAGRPPPKTEGDGVTVKPKGPGPAPAPPGSPERTAGREGLPPGRRNRTSSSVIKSVEDGEHDDDGEQS